MVVYDGEALRGNQMDVRDLAPALLALGEILEFANQRLNGDRATVQVRVKAFKSGCFGVLLEMAQDFLGTLLDFFGPDTKVRNALDILNLLGFTVRDATVSGVIALIALIKLCKGAKPKNRIEMPDGNVKLQFEGKEGADDVVVSKDVERLFDDERVRSAIFKSLEPLRKNGIDDFCVEEKGQRRVLVTKSEVYYFDIPYEAPTELKVDRTPQERIFSITSLSFKEGNKWRLSDGEQSFNVRIEDEDFLKKVDSGLPFAKGDMLRVLLVTNPVMYKEELRTEYIIIKVFEIIRKPRQVDLPE